MEMKNIFNFIVSFMLLIYGNLYGQDNGISVDSLLKNVAASKNDTDKIKKLIWLSNAINCKDSIQKLGYLNQASELARKSHWNKGLLISEIAYGAYYSECQKDYASTINHYLLADSFATKSGDLTEQANALALLGNIYQVSAQYSNAIKTFKYLLDLKLEDQNVPALGNVGLIYRNLGDYATAIIYYDSLNQI